ncbi:MAG TPA: ABC transporter permease [Bryobacteraceae bacterium]|nr:ABC transporter permease [Bryobacteraceae bacterium]
MLRHTLKSLRRSGGVSALAVLALALGIGVNTAVFSVVNAVFLRPLPFLEAGRLVAISETSNNGPLSVSYPNFLDWQRQASAFEAMAVSAPFEATLESHAPAERLPVTYVSSEFFSILRIQPLLGRDFVAGDDRQGAHPVAILSYRIWQTYFGSDPAILGATVSLDRRPYTVIGVLAPRFQFYRPAQVFVPISDAVVRQALWMREDHSGLDAIARLKPRVTLEQAQAQINAIASRLQSAYPGNAGVGARVVTLRERISGRDRERLMILLAAVSLVLLIACVNVAGLLLVRAAGRRREAAVRSALGASRWQVLRWLLLESLVLALAGGALGAVLASWAFAGLARLVPASIDAGGLGIDWRVLGYTLLVSTLTGVLSGLAPAFDAWRLNLVDAMRDGGRTTGGASTTRLRDALVIAELALALVLLVGAGLLFRTLTSLMAVPLGFESEHRITARVSLPEDYPPERSVALFEAITASVTTIPGVRSAGTINQMPLRGFFSSMPWFRDDRPVPERGKLPSADHRAASPEYFVTMGIPLLRGRLLTPADGRVTNFRPQELLDWIRKNRFSVLISDSMAKRFWPGEDPVGKTFRPGFQEMGAQPVKIMGVVGDVRDRGPDNNPIPTFYFSAYQFPQWATTLVVRTRGGDPAAVVPAVRRAVAMLDPAATVSAVATVESIVSDAVAARRLNMQLLGIFAALALLLAAVGIYGVMAFAVNRRAHEIGVRMALGAGQPAVVRMVIGKAVVLGALGVLIGSVAALGLTRLIAGMLYGVKPADPATFLCVGAILFAVAIAASWAPAVRATRVSPIVALRSE